MKTNNILGLYIAFYLAKYNSFAYKNLGFGNQSQTHKKIGEILDVKPYTIRNWRDEFDSLFEHRAGWYQRKLSPSRISVLEAVGNLDEYSLRSIITDILNKNRKSDISKIISIISSENKYEEDIFSQVRGITGQKAEEYFIKWNNINKDYFLKNSVLKDVRTHGCGYDFEISNQNIKLAIEIKGISEDYGGILFTQKEWEVSEKQRDKYYLVIISNITNEEYQIRIINNPFETFNPKRNIQEVIQVSWTVAGNDIKNIPLLKL